MDANPRMRRRTRAAVALCAAGSPSAHAAGVLDTPADIAWVAMSAALVFFMQAGFALLEGGMARAKNATNVIMKNYADLCYGALAFWLLGYGLMFGTNASGWIGTSDFAPDLANGRTAVFFIFQIMFAATAATIVSGAVAERMRFWPYVIGSMLVTGLIYPVFGAWVWGSFERGDGWLKQLGFIDFAGSTVVHSIGGWSALAAVIVLGPRLGRFAPSGAARDIPGHNLPLMALGVFILWLGWFGFNGGSTLAATADIGLIAVNTHLAGCLGFIGANAAQRLLKRPVLMTTAINGAVAGLVAITAGCATMLPPYALLTGFVAGGLMILATDAMARLKLDDMVGAVPVHAVGGVWGTFAAGLFYRGDLFDPSRIVVQLIGIGTAFAWAFPMAYAVFWTLSRTIGLRADSRHEQRGLDISEHYEIGYPEFQRDLTHAGKE